jgi:hypothetical protein
MGVSPPSTSATARERQREARGLAPPQSASRRRRGVFRVKAPRRAQPVMRFLAWDEVEELAANTAKVRRLNVRVVQNPTLSLADDVAVTKRAIDAASEPVILVGHSYGGAVVTEAGHAFQGCGPRLHCRHSSFAGDVSDEEAAFMADSQVPWGLDALGGTISHAIYVSRPEAVTELIEKAASEVRSLVR